MARNKIRGKAVVNSKSPYTTSKRKSQLRTLVTHLIIKEQLEVTEATAAGLVSLADHMVTLAKKGDLHSRRQAAAVVREIYVDNSQEQTALQKLFTELGPRYASRNGGYTRVVKTHNRRGDNAPMAIVQFVK